LGDGGHLVADLQNEWRRSARLALADLDPHRSRLARIRNRSPHALELQVRRRQLTAYSPRASTAREWSSVSSTERARRIAIRCCRRSSSRSCATIGECGGQRRGSSLAIASATQSAGMQLGKPAQKRPDCCPRWARRSVRSMRTSAHRLQQLPRQALPPLRVVDPCAMAGGSPRRAPRHSVLSRRLHTAGSHCGHRPSRQATTAIFTLVEFEIGAACVPCTPRRRTSIPPLRHLSLPPCP